MERCEICERTSAQVRLFACASIEQAMLWFCSEHYIEHVKSAHRGLPLPGCTSLAEAAQGGVERRTQ